MGVQILIPDPPQPQPDIKYFSAKVPGPTKNSVLKLVQFSERPGCWMQVPASKAFGLICQMPGMPLQCSNSVEGAEGV